MAMSSSGLASGRQAVVRAGCDVEGRRGRADVRHGAGQPGEVRDLPRWVPQEQRFARGSLGAAAEYFPRPGLAFVPITDIAPVTVSLCYLAGSTNRALAMLEQVATSIAARPPTRVATAER